MASLGHFDALRISLASPETIRDWSYGEVKKPETINYRTFKPERDGLFCERIFGPSRDWECHCGKYKKVKFKGIVCDRCGVEVTRAKVRRRRMGHVELAAPVCHIWYLKGVPSPISLLLDISPKSLEKVIYFASYIVTHVDTRRVHEQTAEVQRALSAHLEEERALFESYKIQRAEELAERIAKPKQEGEEIDVGALEQDMQEDLTYEETALNERCEELQNALKLLSTLEVKQLISEAEYRQIQKLLGVLAEKLSSDFEGIVRAGLGAQAVKELLQAIDLEELCRELRKEIQETASGPRKGRSIKRLAMAEGFRRSKNRPEWMILDAIPVLPPELRPMVQLDGGRFATSDVNDLYRRIINRNNRLRRIMEIKAPESIINHEKRLLQEAVDALIDNSRRTHPVVGTNRRPLKSLSDLLKGKDGRFRKNLLGKRVDYSGRSVIVVGPELRLDQCGLPREMALELFKPFVMKRLVDRGYTTNIKTAKKMVDRLRPEVWDALEEVIEDHPVMLNRAPTLHRLGIQAFEPVLVDGKAIQIPPLVCEAFNADFDGDQMAVHVPLSAYAQAEARLLMLASHNLFKPADGRPVCAPVYDIVLGCYYLSQLSRQAVGFEPTQAYGSAEEALLAYHHRKYDLHMPCWIRIDRLVVDSNVDPLVHAYLLAQLEHLCAMAYETPEGLAGPRFTAGDPPMVMSAKEARAVAQSDGVEDADAGGEGYQRLRIQFARRISQALESSKISPKDFFEAKIVQERIQTTIGRAFLNKVIPIDLRAYDRVFDKKALARLVSVVHEKHGPDRAVQLLDDVTRIGFEFSTVAGISIGLTDMDIETRRDQIIAETEGRVNALTREYDMGNITQTERQQRVLELWLDASREVADDIVNSIDHFNPIYMMVTSGARGNIRQVTQLSGMRGLMSDPFGRLIEDLPVKSNFHEGLKVFEYFVSTHGARKGLADTALRTADAGYLTRRLVDVAQDVIVRGEDCGTTNGVEMTPIYEEDCVCYSCGEEDLHREGPGPHKCVHCGADLPPVSSNLMVRLENRVRGRVASAPVVHPKTGEILVDANEEFTPERVERALEAGVRRVLVRSPLTCELGHGICVRCYGRDLAHWRMVEVGEAVGVIAAESIGEPGTQLTMRTFHTGGIAAKYLTGVADVKKKKQEALRQLHEDIDRGLVRLDSAMAERENTRAIQALLKVLEDPISGLLRVVELFEARKPKGQAIVAELDGAVAAIDERGLRRVVIHSDQPLDDPMRLRSEKVAERLVDAPTNELIVDTGEELNERILKRLKKAKFKTVRIQRSYVVPYRGYLRVAAGMKVRAGDRLTEGPLEPQQVLEMRGVRGVQDYLLKEIQRVYRSQDVEINDKHIEVIIRQMLRKRRVTDHGDTDFLPGQVVDRFLFDEENRRIVDLGGKPAQAVPMLLGITEASLQTESFLSAASFQKTTKILTDAAVRGKSDPLRGLKENVIIGRLIPAGSGLLTYRETRVGPADPTAALRLAASLDIALDEDISFDEGEEAKELLESLTKDAIEEEEEEEEEEFEEEEPYEEEEEEGEEAEEAEEGFDEDFLEEEEE